MLTPVDDDDEAQMDHYSDCGVSCSSSQG